MKKISQISMVCALALNINANDLGTINIESSTIDDKYETVQSAISSTAVFSAEEVKEIDPQSVADILNKVPGVTTSLTGTDSFKVHIRGIDNQMYMGEKPGVAIVIDGVPVQETTGKINVDLDNIESIKVIKGSASYLYGNDALAGAVIITTKRPKGESFSSIEAEAGSFGTKRLALSTNQSFENSSLQLQGSLRDTNGYWDDAFVNIKSINGKYQYYIDDTSDITVGYDYTKRKTGDGNSVSGITEAQENPTSKGYYSYGGYYNSDLTKAFVTYSKTFANDSELMLRAHTYEDDKNYKLARYTKDMYEKWNQTGAKAEYKIPFEDFALMVGTDIQRNKTDEQGYTIATGALNSDFKTKEDINAYYTEIKYQPTDKFSTTLNIRYDDIKLAYKDKLDDSFDVDPDYDNTSYRVGFNYKFNDDLSMYSSISTGFRTPSVGQISANKELLADDPTYDIPSDIDVEKTYNYEIGIRGKNSYFTYDASIFQIDRKDYIGKIAGSYISSDEEEESGYDNVGDMRSRGFELALSTDKSKQISFDLAYTYLLAKFTDYTISQQQTDDGDRFTSDETFQDLNLSGNYVSRSPKHMINLTMDVKLSEQATLTPELIYKGSYYADEANAFKQGGYTVVNLKANYKVNDNFELFGRIDNVFDKNYFMFVNVNSSALATMEDATIRVAPPRAFYAGLRYKF